MAFTQNEIAQYQALVQPFIERRRPAPQYRDQVDLSFRIADQSIEIFQVRSRFNRPNDKFELPVAKTTWVRTQQVWRIYWHRADMKWHGYDPQLEVDTLEEFLAVIDADEYHCFFG